MGVSSIQQAVAAAKCGLCGCRLYIGTRDDFDRGLCGDCRDRPEARRFAPGAAAGPREFTAADKSLIRSVAAYMSPRQLLGILNERLLADLGPDAEQYTMEQLHEELHANPAPARADDWAGLRKLLAAARREGVIEKVTVQVIDDFAVVFSLTSAQVLRLKDVVLSAREDAQ